MASAQDILINAVFLFSGTSALCLFLFGIWAVCVSVRNAYFHPLSNFPGPKSAAATPIPFVKALVQGDIVNWVMDLHAKYGDVVRNTPDELSFISPSAWQDICTIKPQLPKVKKGGLQSASGVPSLATETVIETHARQRRILAPAFSERALREQEDILKHHTDLLVSKLNDQIAPTKTPSVTLNIARWYNFTTFDTIGDLLFNDPFHSLESSADHPWVEAIYASEKIRVLITAFDHFPPWPAIVNYLMPRSLTEKAWQHFRWSQEKISRRIESKTSRPDFMTYILDSNEGKEKMTREEIDAQGSFFILAGSETTALTCTSSTWFFLKNPAVYDRLKKEIREAFQSMDEITVPASAKLPYLHAVITEALRLHPPGAVAVPRLVDRPGVVVSGHQIPVGTRCGIPGKPMFRSPLNFVEANTYVPERWLPEADPKYDADRKRAYEPFMVGPRNCLGKPLAWAEMKLILCKVIWKFDMELGEGNKNDWSMEQKLWLLPERSPVYVKITPRQ